MNAMLVQGVAQKHIHQVRLGDSFEVQRPTNRFRETSRHLREAGQALRIKRQFGTFSAARYLRNHAWPIIMARNLLASNPTKHTLIYS